jgi:mannose-1-phosphate guanylyltransferase
MSDSSHFYACIMAGGSGERFWPMSRARTPKHLLKLFSDRTLVEDTVRRLEGVVPLANVLVLTNTAQLENTRVALKGVIAEANIIAEPAKRDTAAAAHHHYEVASALFQIAIVMASAMIITGISVLAVVALGLGGIGAAFTAIGLLAPHAVHLF